MSNKEEHPPGLAADDLEELYEFAPCGYISTLPDGRIVRVNETFLRQIGRTRDELLSGVKFQELMSMAGRVFYDTHFAPLIRIQGHVKEIACDLLRAGNDKLPVLVNAVQVMGPSGEPSSIRFTVFDATERRRYEADLLAARRRSDHFKTIVQASADSILSFDGTGDIKTWNAGAEKMFGVPEADAVGTKVWDAVRLKERETAFQAAFEELRSGRSVHHSDVARGAAGEPMDVAISLTPHIEAPGELTSISAIIRDTTERQRAIEAQHKQELLQNLVDSQEAERQRFARDLHDHLGQQLTGLRLALTHLKATAEPQAAAQIADIDDQAQQIDRDLSFLAFELRPNVLNEVGLFEALDNFVSEWSRNHAVTANFHGNSRSGKRVVPAIEINLYRIAQESLNNVLKHARANQVNVIVEERENEITLIVEDDGVGFVIEEKSDLLKGSGHGLGLLGMRERAAVIGGSLDIESRPNGGTTVFVRAPVTYIE
ncbi:MAG: PAS domain S-box protein [Pyrinomonadaceae bacterium]